MCACVPSISVFLQIMNMRARTRTRMNARLFVCAVIHSHARSAHPSTRIPYTLHGSTRTRTRSLFAQEVRHTAVHYIFGFAGVFSYRSEIKTAECALLASVCVLCAVLINYICIVVVVAVLFATNVQIWVTFVRSDRVRARV